MAVRPSRDQHKEGCVLVLSDFGSSLTPDGDVNPAIVASKELPGQEKTSRRRSRVDTMGLLYFLLY
jgi:hypothetical protein